MALNPSDADVTITLAVALKKQVWSFSVHHPGKSTVRAAGVLATGATAHSGLAIALIAAMKTVTPKKENGPAVIRIITEDTAFGAAINNLSAGIKVKGLRAAHSLFYPLKKSLNRYKIVTEVLLAADNRILSIRNWGKNAFRPEIEGRVSLKVFTPRRVQESVLVSV